MFREKTILLFILLTTIILISNLVFVDAKLSEEQLNEAVNKILEKSPNCRDIEGARNFVISQDCASAEIGFPITFSCGDNTNHTYECRFGIHYLDDEVISILSSRTEISDSNINVNSPNSSQIISKENTNFNFQIGFTLALIGNIIEIAIIINLTRKRKIKDRKNLLLPQPHFLIHI
ncbi:hypothetical protein CO038_03325 [Candidatus Pacearchaeota archaeon CG_4_9_14_0_2_um_filter_39_13]|nr:MAG: hypothetical protein CO038_03325 [Candidatus Pacearchaeota archaeon CG_4_9_14_0_2_um_filter_39_13]